MKKIINLIALEESYDMRTGVMSYTVDPGTTDAGIIVPADNAHEHDMLIMNTLYEPTTGPFFVKMKPFRIPAKRYKIGDVVARLIIL